MIRALLDVESKLEVRETDGKPPVIVGYASVFYDANDPGTEYQLWERGRERILPGAFDRALRENDDVRALFNHDSNIVLGRSGAGTLRLRTDHRGLGYEIDPPDTQQARDLLVSIKRGDVSGSSFAFEVTDENWRTENKIDIREIRGVKLYDVGPVVYPAYKAATSGLRAELAAEARAAFDRWQAEREPRMSVAFAEALCKTAVLQ